MSFAEGLLLAYLKVGVLAAAIIAVIAAIGVGVQKLYAWERKASGDGNSKAGDDAGEDPGQ